jgi:hypothetical protein
MKLNSDEIILRKSRANHLKLFEGVGGRLFLTNQRLFFKSHFFNVQTHEETIPLQDIVSIEAKGSDFISGKMKIFLRNGSVEKFYVPKRKKWVDDIEKAIEEGKAEKTS